MKIVLVIDKDTRVQRIVTDEPAELAILRDMGALNEGAENTVLLDQAGTTAVLPGLVSDVFAAFAAEAAKEAAEAQESAKTPQPAN